jgi:glycosyltransferase involved in cell wall biosynthesis
LTPLEAAVFGRPAITLRAGGFLDTVVEGKTGVFFDRPEPSAIGRAVDEAARRKWDEDLIRAHAAAFAEDRFVERLRAHVEDEAAEC